MSRVTERRNRNKGEEEQGAYWMDTYGDMITLLLTFFVMLFAFSTLDADKWESFVEAFDDGQASVIIPALSPEDVLESVVDQIEQTEDETGSEDPDSSTTGWSISLENFIALYESIQEYVELYDLNAELIADFDSRILTIRFSENVFFASGRADLDSEAMATLDRVTEMILENIDLISMVNIEGHTDNVPISNSQFSDNWDLSVTRATTALRYMSETGLIDGQKFKASGYGEFQPIASNETEEGKAQNRRIDFVVEAIN